MLRTYPQHSGAGQPYGCSPCRVNGRSEWINHLPRYAQVELRKRHMQTRSQRMQSILAARHLLDVPPSAAARGELRDAAVALLMWVDDQAGENAGAVWPWPDERTHKSMIWPPVEATRYEEGLTLASAFLLAELERVGVQPVTAPAPDEVPIMEVRPYKEGESLAGGLMCYHCRYVFPIPENARTTSYVQVTCPHCNSTEHRDQFKAAKTDPYRHPLGWPYDDPTVGYDC